jgi:hypothetical protein
LAAFAFLASAVAPAVGAAQIREIEVEVVESPALGGESFGTVGPAAILDSAREAQLPR